MRGLSALLLTQQLLLRSTAGAFVAPAALPVPSLCLRGGSAFAGLGRAVRPVLGYRQHTHAGVVGLRAGSTTLSFGAPAAAATSGADKPACTVLIGKRDVVAGICSNAEAAAQLFGFKADAAVTAAMLDSVDGSGSATSFVLDDSGEPQRLCLAVLPDKTSRHNHPLSVHTITTLLDSCVPSKGNVHVVLAGVSASTPPAPLAAAVAKAFPLYSLKTQNGNPKAESARDIHVSFVDASGTVMQEGGAMRACEAVSQGVRLACRLVDTAPEQMSSEDFAAECRKVANALPGVSMTELVGDELRDKVAFF